MPVHTAVPIRAFDQESFHQVDKRVTGVAFEIHNEFGRYLDEGLYQTELTRRCREFGLKVEPELQIDVTFQDFTKTYFADQLIDDGVIIENKAVAALDPSHRGQALNYLFLCGLHHGTLLNFRTERVQHEFVSTSLTLADRRRYDVVDSHWKAMTPQCGALCDIMHQLLKEWGAFLDPVLYRDALTYFLGGEACIVQEVRVTSAGSVIGTQRMHLLAEDIAFSVTAATHRPDAVLEHQRRFLRHTPLRALHWVNLNHKKIELHTIERQ